MFYILEAEIEIASVANLPINLQISYMYNVHVNTS